MDPYIINLQFKSVKKKFDMALENGLYNTYFVFFHNDETICPYILVNLLFIPPELMAFIGVQCGALKWNLKVNKFFEVRNKGEIGSRPVDKFLRFFGLSGADVGFATYRNIEYIRIHGQIKENDMEDGISNED